MDTIKSAFVDLRGLLGFAPEYIVAAVILGVALLVGFVAHATALTLTLRVVRHRSPNIAQFLEHTRQLTRIATLLVFVGLALPAAPLDPAIAELIGHLVLLAFIILAGWTAVIALHVATDLYLRRFRVDVEDNLLARKHLTQVRILRRTADTLIVIVTVSAALMTFGPVRQYGVSLFASAGVAGLVIGLAARPVLSNLIAGIQLAVTQPIRIDDVVVVQNEWGQVEEITSTYVVLRLWDQRRLIVPLTFFIEQPFQNWTRERSGMFASVMLYLDFDAPLDRLREKAKEVAAATPGWDGNLIKVQVTGARETCMEVRILAGARSASVVGDLSNEIREKMIDFLWREHPDALPRTRGVELPADRAGQPAKT